MSQVGLPSPLNSSQINQADSVSSQTTTGNVGNKSVQENNPPETGNVVASNTTQTSMTTNYTQSRHISRPSSKVIRGNHTGFNHIKGFFKALKDTVSAKLHKGKKSDVISEKTQMQSQSEVAQKESTIKNNIGEQGNLEEALARGIEHFKAIPGVDEARAKALAKVAVFLDIDPRASAGVLEKYNNEELEKFLTSGFEWFKKACGGDEVRAKLLLKVAVLIRVNHKMTQALFAKYDNESLEGFLAFRDQHPNLGYDDLKMKYESGDDFVQSERRLKFVHKNQLKDELSKIEVHAMKIDTKNLPQEQQKTINKLKGKMSMECLNAFSYCCSIVGKGNDKKILKKFFNELEGLAKNGQLIIKKEYGERSSSLNAEVFMQLVDKYNIAIK